MKPQVLPFYSAKTGMAPPHSVEAEQALLGALMMNNALFYDVEDVLAERAFYVEFHAETYRTIRSLVTKGHEASPLTVRDNLRSKNVFEQDTSLLEHLTKLVENAALSADMRALAEIINHHYRQRQLIDISNDMQWCIKGSSSPEETEAMMVKVESDLFRLSETGALSGRGQSWHDRLKSTRKVIYDATNRSHELAGVTSGFDCLDNMLLGFQAGQYIVLAARPSMGKTSLAVNMAVNAAKAKMKDKPGGAKVGIFSLEMSADELMLRIVSGESGVNTRSMKRGELSQSEKDMITAFCNSMDELDIVIDDRPGPTINDVRARARRMVRREGVELIVIDYITLIRGAKNRYENSTAELTDVSSELRGMVNELKVPVIVLSQLSRAVESRENKRPQLADLRQSGAIEQDADVIMFLYREEYYLKNEGGAAKELNPDKKARLDQVRGLTELNVAKNRHDETGGVTLLFDERYTKFREIPLQNDE